MIELRYLKKKKQNEALIVFDDVEIVLQYREKELSIDLMTMSPDFSEWSEWKDVPIMEEE